MNIPVIVDVAIGLIFIYLILSLLASEILELIATVLQWRAQHLRQSIINLLAGDTITDQNIEAAKRLTKDLYNHPLLNDLNQEARGLFATLFRKITWFFSWIYQNITGGEGVFGNKVTAPSYIPGETFATALIERLGVAKLVEKLIDAKLNRFKTSIIKDIGTIIGCNDKDILDSKALEKGLAKELSEKYKVLNFDLNKIYEQFIAHEFTLIAAIDKISLQIDRFINQFKNDYPEKLDEQKKLDLWKRGLFGKQNELAIVNGGLKPTLEEVADLINLSSRTYQVFEDEFKDYKQKRQKEVNNELEKFLLLFNLSIRIIVDTETNFDEKNDNILSIRNNKYSKIWVADTDSPKRAISLSEVGTLLIENDLNKPGDLKAFKEGFGEKGRELLGSKVLRGKEILPIAFLVILMIVTWFVVFHFAELFITPKGGISFVALLIVLFILFLLLYNLKPNHKKWDDRESLSNVLDVYYFSDPQKITEFREAFRKKITPFPG
jgi:hypothetical protein